MALIPWRPFSEFDRFFNEDDWMLPVVPRTGEPPMDVYETESAVVAKLSLPGIDPKNVEVSVTDGVLSVRGTHEDTHQEQRKGYWRREIRSGSFERMVRLPSSVSGEGVTAAYEQGMLEITMPKTTPPPAGEKKVPITVR